MVRPETSVHTPRSVPAEKLRTTPGEWPGIFFGAQCSDASDPSPSEPGRLPDVANAGRPVHEPRHGETVVIHLPPPRQRKSARDEAANVSADTGAGPEASGVEEVIFPVRGTQESSSEVGHPQPLSPRLDREPQPLHPAASDPALEPLGGERLHPQRNVRPQQELLFPEPPQARVFPPAGPAGKASAPSPQARATRQPPPVPIGGESAHVPAARIPSARPPVEPAQTAQSVAAAPATSPEAVSTAWNAAESAGVASTPVDSDGAREGQGEIYDDRAPAAVSPSPEPAQRQYRVAEAPEVATLRGARAQFWLRNGEHLSGILVGLSENSVAIEHPALGAVELRRDAVARRLVEIFLRNGDRLLGELEGETEQTVMIRHSSLGTVTIARSEICSRVANFLLTNGDRIVGEVLHESDSYVQLRTSSLGVVTLPRAAIQRVLQQTF